MGEGEGEGAGVEVGGVEVGEEENLGGGTGRSTRHGVIPTTPTTTTSPSSPSYMTRDERPHQRVRHDHLLPRPPPPPHLPPESHERVDHLPHVGEEEGPEGVEVGAGGCEVVVEGGADWGGVVGGGVGREGAEGGGGGEEVAEDICGPD